MAKQNSKRVQVTLRGYGGWLVERFAAQEGITIGDAISRFVLIGGEADQQALTRRGLSIDHWRKAIEALEDYRMNVHRKHSSKE